MLAVVAVLDAWILGCLAFTLSHRHAKPVGAYGGVMHHPESPYMNPGSIYKGTCNMIFDNNYTIRLLAYKFYRKYYHIIGLFR